MRVNTLLLPLIISLFFFSSSAIAGDNVMKISSFTADPGDVVLVELEISNEDPFIAFDLSIPLPEGFSYVSGSFQLNPDRRNGHTSSASVTSGGTLKILSYSMTNAVYHGNEGVIASFQLRMGMIPGNYELSIQNASIVSGSFPYSNILTGTQDGQVQITGEIPEQYTLTIAIEGEGSVMVDETVYSAPITAYEGSMPDLEAIAAEGWEFAAWSGDLVSGNPMAQITMDGDKHITATFTEISDTRYTLTLMQSGEGSVLVNDQIYDEPVTVNENTILNLQALPLPGWQFDQWEGDAAGTDPEINLLMDANKDITAVFSLIPTGENSMQINDAAADTGQVLELELEINNEAPFVAFSAEVNIPDGFTYVEHSAQLNDKRASDHILSENLLPGNVLQLMSTSASRSSFDDLEGPVVFFSVMAPDVAGEYTVSISEAEITGLADTDILSAISPGTITISEPIPTYIITASAADNGSIDPSGEILVEQGSSQAFVMTPGEGYHTSELLVDDAAIDFDTNDNWDAENHTYTFNNIEDNHSIHVSFAINTYTITASTNGNGSIDPEGEVMAEHGSSQSFALAANEGHHLSALIIDEAAIDLDTDANWDAENRSYTFNNIVQAHSIEALFAINTYTITATAGDNGSIEPEGEVMAEHGSSQGFAIVPDEGHHLSELLVDDVATNLDTDENWDAENNSYTFNNIVQAHSIEALFAINTYTITATAGDNGSIDPEGEISISHGQDQAFTLSPGDNYHVAFIKVDGEDINLETDENWNAENLTFTLRNVSNSHSLEAGFAIDTYVITATAGSNGNISPEGEVTVDHGSNQVFTIAAGSGYRLSFVRVDGNNINLGSDENWNAANNSYTFSNVTQDHSIEAGFEVDDTGMREAELPQLHIYPNPASTTLYVESDVPVLRLDIIDLNGRQVYLFEPDNAAFQIDLSSLSVGVYLLRIETEKGQRTKRLQIGKK